MWSCGICGFENEEAEAVACLICSTPREVATEASQAKAEEESKAAEEAKIKAEKEAKIAAEIKLKADEEAKAAAAQARAEIEAKFKEASRAAAESAKKNESQKRSLKEMIEQGCPLLECMKAGFKLRDFLDLKVPIAECLLLGYTPSHFSLAGVPLAEMHAAGVSAVQCRAAYPLTSDFQIFGIQALREAGFTLPMLEDCGYGGGLTVAEHHAAGHSVGETLKHYRVGPDFQVFGVQALAAAGAAGGDLKQCGYTLAEMHAAGVPAAQCAKGLKLGPEFQVFGVKALIAGGATGADLKVCGYSVADMHAAGATVAQCLKGLKHGPSPDFGVFGLAALAAAGLQWADLKRCGFTFADLKGQLGHGLELGSLFRSAGDIEDQLVAARAASSVVLPGDVFPFPTLAPPLSLAAEASPLQANMALLPVVVSSVEVAKKKTLFGMLTAAPAAKVSPVWRLEIPAKVPPVVAAAAAPKAKRFSMLGPAAAAAPKPPAPLSPDMERVVSHLYADPVSAAVVGKVQFPKPRGINVNMMPIVLGALDSVPPELRHYAAVLAACPVSAHELGRIGYLTIQEFAEAQEPGPVNRRSGLHTEAGHGEDDDPRLDRAAGLRAAEDAVKATVAEARSTSKQAAAAVADAGSGGGGGGGGGAGSGSSGSGGSGSGRSGGAYVEETDPMDVALALAEKLAWRVGPYSADGKPSPIVKPAPVRRKEKVAAKREDGEESFEYEKDLGFEPEVRRGAFKGGSFLCASAPGACVVWNGRVLASAARPYVRAHRAWAAEHAARVGSGAGGGPPHKHQESMVHEAKLMEALAWADAQAAAEVAGTRGGCEDGLVGVQGGVEPLRAALGPGYAAGAGELVWLADAAPREVLPPPGGAAWALFRLTTHAVGAWYPQHSTPNPLGVKPGPGVRVASGDKFNKKGAEVINPEAQWSLGSDAAASQPLAAAARAASIWTSRTKLRSAPAAPAEKKDLGPSASSFVAANGPASAPSLKVSAMPGKKPATSFSQNPLSNSK